VNAESPPAGAPSGASAEPRLAGAAGAAVSARGVVKRFGRAAALRDLDLDIAAGAGLAVLGDNGAGKSTLLRLLAGLARPSKGRIEVDGRPASHRDSRARLGFVGHATALAPSLSVRENLLFAARLHGLPDARRRADQRVESEGLAELAERPARALSRGQAQRAAIARALIHDPALVLLDEPYTGLDAASAERLATRLAEIRAAGRTLVVVTHDPSALAGLVDGAVRLAAGRLESA